MINYLKNLFVKAEPNIQADKRASVFGYFSGDPKRDETGIRIHPGTLHEIYKYNSDITNCVDRIARDAFSAGYEWYDPRDDDASVPQSIKDELNGIFNGLMPWKDWKELVIRDCYGITGGGYLNIVMGINGNRIIGLDFIDSRSMAIVSDKHGTIYRFIQRVMGGAYEMVQFEPHEVVYFRRIRDTQNELFGMSPIESIIWDAKTDISAMISNFKFFENDAKPSTLFILDDAFAQMDQVKQNEIMDKIKENFSGADKRNKSAIMSMIKDVKSLSLAPKDIEFIAGRRLSTQKICARYGVSEFILGYTEKVNNNNGEELRQEYWNSTINPIEQSFSEVINRDFLGLIPELVGKVAFRAKPKVFEKAKKELSDRLLRELEKGIITRKTYKIRMGQEITDSDLKDPMFDIHIIYNGSSAVLPEDIGVDPVIDPNDPDTANRIAKVLENQT